MGLLRKTPLRDRTPFERRTEAMAPNRYYGDGGTIHDSRKLDVEVRDGKVVAVWFRCQMLPYKQVDVSFERAIEMSFTEALPGIVGVELTREWAS